MNDLAEAFDKFCKIRPKNERLSKGIRQTLIYIYSIINIYYIIYIYYILILQPTFNIPGPKQTKMKAHKSNWQNQTPGYHFQHICCHRGGETTTGGQWAPFLKFPEEVQLCKICLPMLKNMSRRDDMFSPTRLQQSFDLNIEWQVPLNVPNAISKIGTPTVPRGVCQY